MTDELPRLLPMDIPLIQAPMAGVQDWRMAAAVSAAGGLGSIPCGMLSAEQVEAEVAAFRNTTSAPVNLNFFCHRMSEPTEDVMQRWQECLTGFYDEAGIQPSSSGALRLPYDDAMADVVERLRPEVVTPVVGTTEEGEGSRRATPRPRPPNSPSLVASVTPWLELRGPLKS